MTDNTDGPRLPMMCDDPAAFRDEQARRKAAERERDDLAKQAERLIEENEQLRANVATLVEQLGEAERRAAGLCAALSSANDIIISRDALKNPCATIARVEEVVDRALAGAAQPVVEPRDEATVYGDGSRWPWWLHIEPGNDYYNLPTEQHHRHWLTLSDDGLDAAYGKGWEDTAPDEGMTLQKVNESAWRLEREIRRRFGYAPHPSGTEGSPTVHDLLGEIDAIARDWLHDLNDPEAPSRDDIAELRELSERYRRLLAASPPDGTAPAVSFQESDAALARLIRPDGTAPEPDGTDETAERLRFRIDALERAWRAAERDADWAGRELTRLRDATRPPDGMPGEPDGELQRVVNIAHEYGQHDSACDYVCGAGPCSCGWAHVNLPPYTGLAKVLADAAAYVESQRDEKDWCAKCREWQPCHGCTKPRAAPPTVPGEPPADREEDVDAPPGWRLCIDRYDDEDERVAERPWAQGTLSEAWAMYRREQAAVPSTAPTTPPRAPVDEAAVRAAVETVLHWMMDDIDTVRVRLSILQREKGGSYMAQTVDRELFDLHMRCCKHIDALDLPRAAATSKPEGPTETIFERLKRRIRDEPGAAARMIAAIDDICDCGGSLKHNEHAEGCAAAPEEEP